MHNSPDVDRPNFLILGAMKAGTTIAWDVLSQHPEIFMSDPKEPHYFAWLAAKPTQAALEGDDAYARTEAEYAALFNNANGAKIVGEASTSNLHVAGTAQIIHEAVPDARLLCILRNPVDRAYSHFLHLIRLGIEQEQDFPKALQLEEERIRQRVPYGRYRANGLYYQQLVPYLERFPRERLFICLFDDLVSQPHMSYRRIFEFLGVDADFVADTSIRRNPSGIPKHRWLERVISSPSAARTIARRILPRRAYKAITQLRDRNLTKPPMSPTIRDELAHYYQNDLGELEKLLRRDLGKWYSSPSG